jgi:hypothetical protein
MTMLFLMLFSAPDSISMRDAFVSNLNSWRSFGLEFNVENRGISNVARDLIGLSGEPIKPGDLVELSTVHFRQYGTKFLYEAVHHYESSSKEGEVEKAAHDGKTSLTFQDDRKNKSGMIGPNPSLLFKIQCVKSDNGAFLFGSLGNVDIRESLNDSSTTFTVEEKTEVIDGHECIICNINDKKASHRIWIDPKRGYNYLRWVLTPITPNTGLNDYGTWEVNNVKLSEVNGKWAPVSGDHRHQMKVIQDGVDVTTEKVDWTESVVLNDFVIKDSFPDSDFTFTFPDGTEIYDSKVGQPVGRMENGVIKPYLGNTFENELLSPSTEENKQIKKTVNSTTTIDPQQQLNTTPSTNKPTHISHYKILYIIGASSMFLGLTLFIYTLILRKKVREDVS